MENPKTLENPLTPKECDLRDFSYMPLDVVRLRDSDIAGIRNPEAFRAAVLAWCVAWHQIPAGSIPDDDSALCRLLGYGRDIETWRAIREDGALHGFIKCSDGRLYHPVVAEKAIEAWNVRLAQRARTAAARAARLGQRQSVTSSVTSSVTENVTKPVTQPVTEPVTSDATVSVTGSVTSSKGREGKGRESKSSDSSFQSESHVEMPDSEIQKPDLEIVKSAFDAWCDLAHEHQLATPRKLDDTRAKAIRARLREHGGLEGWMAMLAVVRTTPFLLGQNDRDWRASLDWVCGQKNFRKIVDGNYARKPNGAHPGAAAAAPSAPARIAPPPGAQWFSGNDEDEPFGFKSWLLKRPELEIASVGGAMVPCLGDCAAEGTAMDLVNIVHENGGSFVERPNWDALAEWCKAGWITAENDQRWKKAVARVTASLDGPVRSLAVFTAAIGAALTRPARNGLWQEMGV